MAAAARAMAREPACGADPRHEGSACQRVALWSLFGFVAALQVSIVAAQALLAVMVLCWVAMLASGRARFVAPPFFRPLVVYAGSRWSARVLGRSAGRASRTTSSCCCS